MRHACSHGAAGEVPDFCTRLRSGEGNEDRPIVSQTKIYCNDSTFFPGVPWGGASNDSKGRRQWQFLAFLLAISSETLEIWHILLYGDMQSVVGFSVIP